MFRIRTVEAVAISVPLSAPIKMSGVTVSAAENLMVCITDTEGRTGWGEASSAPTMTGEFPEGMVAAARHIGTRIEGAEITDIAAIHPLIAPLIYANQGPKSAIECALLDLWGQAAGLPMHALLGGALRDSADILTMITGGDLAAEKAFARRQADAGFRAYKVKVGTGTPERDLERATAIRALLGPDVQISADANQGYSTAQGVTFAKGAVAAGMDFLEQLVAGDDLEGMTACARATAVPLGADEGLHSIDDIRRHHALGAARGGSIKTIKMGGALPVMDAGRLMVDLRMSINLAGKVADTSIASAAICHLAMALPQLDWKTSITNQYLAVDPVTDPVRIVDGAVRRIDRPGLGVRPDLDQLAKLRVDRPGARSVA